MSDKKSLFSSVEKETHRDQRAFESGGEQPQPALCTGAARCSSRFFPLEFLRRVCPDTSNAMRDVHLDNETCRNGSGVRLWCGPHSVVCSISGDQTTLHTDLENSTLTTVGVGEVCNFAAYMFAPATLVTPLGALSVLISAVLAPYLLGEQLNVVGKLGCLLCVLGSILLVIHAPQEQEVTSLQDMTDKLLDPGFLVYLSAVLLLCLVLVFYFSPRVGRSTSSSTSASARCSGLHHEAADQSAFGSGGEAGLAEEVSANGAAAAAAAEQHSSSISRIRRRIKRTDGQHERKDRESSSSAELKKRRRRRKKKKEEEEEEEEEEKKRRRTETAK
ncbi:hypothetical protein F7725_006427 [Dissostichus mawsoni]|uniref:Uncharacterized protein n=1 Tax=Dissostichus mawsoni TaxID=36200 RepID=A0A7J5XTW2_DISMA|nr:hypothetical protein F7725_006427 [Dissostichus mawsoni]